MCFLPVHEEIADSVSRLLACRLDSTDVKCLAAQKATVLMCTVWTQPLLGATKMKTPIILIWSRRLTLSFTAYLQGRKIYRTREENTCPSPNKNDTFSPHFILL